MKQHLQLIASFFLAIVAERSYAQCSGGTSAGIITPATSWQTATIQGGQYFTFTVPAGACNKYDFSFCQGGGSVSFDSQITLLTSANVYANGYSDDACGLSSEILNWSPAAGTYRVLVNQFSCASNATNATLAYRYTAPGNNGDYQYLNNATVSGTCINLTAAVNNQLGCAWDANSTLNFSANFSYDFTINLGNSDAGADGIAFVMQNDPRGRCVCGTAGGSMGAGGITNSLTVEVDTYLNTEDRDDGMTAVVCAGGPEPDHLDIWLNGVVNPELGSSCVTDAGERVAPTAVRLMSGAAIYNIENGLDHKLRIAWNAASTTLTATIFDNALVTSYGSISYVFNPMTVFGTNTPFFGFTGSTGGLNNNQYFCNPPVLLPIELTEFSVACNLNGGVNFHWKTLSELNNDHFTIERSVDGTNFVVVGKINGAGNSSQPKMYDYTDHENLNGHIYFRLSQTDLSGQKTFFPMQEIDCTNAKELEIISIFSDEVGMNITANAANSGMHNIKIFDAMGKLIYSSSENFSQGKNFVSFSAGAMAKGIYIVSLDNGQTRVVRKFVR